MSKLFVWDLTKLHITLVNRTVGYRTVRLFYMASYSIQEAHNGHTETAELHIFSDGPHIFKLGIFCQFNVDNDIPNQLGGVEA